jgi:hypothetical protein
MRSLLFTTLLCLSLSAFAVNGAAVKEVTVDNKSALITVVNQSNHDITGFTIGIDATAPDGTVDHSEYGDDYGPLTGKTLRAHESVVVTYPMNIDVRSTTAKIIVAIYNDGTAEADNKETLDQIISVRAGIAKALRISATTLNAALSDAKPSEYARTRLEQKLAENDAAVNQSYLRGSLEVIKAASKSSNERVILQENAARYDKEAAAFEAYANIRRLP